MTAPAPPRLAPLETAGLLSRITFAWISPLFELRGALSPAILEQRWPLPALDRTEAVAARLMALRTPAVIR
jgi:hypothetical protein